MSYATVEAAALTVLRLLAAYSATNSSRSDWRILAKGGTRVVILSPGGIRQREVVAAPRRMRTVWTTNLDLYERFTREGELDKAVNNLITDRQVIIDHFDSYPTLNGTAGVINVLLTGGDEPELFAGENRQWLVQRMTLETEERTSITIAE